MYRKTHYQRHGKPRNGSTSFLVKNNEKSRSKLLRGLQKILTFAQINNNYETSV